MSLSRCLSRLFSCLALVAWPSMAGLSLAGCSPGPTGSTAPAGSEGGQATASGGFAGAAFPAGLRAPDFRLTDQDGASVSPRGSKGHVLVVAFVWDGSPAATLAAQQIRGALDELGSRADMVDALLVASPEDGHAGAADAAGSSAGSSARGAPGGSAGDAMGSSAHGVAERGPRDSRPTGAEARGRRLLREVSLRGRAAYLTGTPARLRAVWRSYGIALPSAGRSAFLASPTVLVVDRRGFERVGFALEQLTPEGLAHDVDALLAGARTAGGLRR